MKTDPRMGFAFKEKLNEKSKKKDVEESVLESKRIEKVENVEKKEKNKSADSNLTEKYAKQVYEYFKGRKDINYNLIKEVKKIRFIL